MNEQYEKSLTKLELDKVLAMLSDHAASQAAKDRCLAVRPSTDADEIRHLLDETSAACACITVKGSPSFGGLYDVGASLDRADRGGCLSPEELLRIAAVLKSARQTKAYSEGEGRSAQEPGVLDEITANLDAETEARVLEALRRASAGRTVLSVSHRVYEDLGGRTIEIRTRE